MLKVPPGAMSPEFHAPLLAVDVCDVESRFVHVTVVPTATVIGFGENAVVVSVDAPATIDTPFGVDGVGVVTEGVDGDE